MVGAADGVEGDAEVCVVLAGSSKERVASGSATGLGFATGLGVIAGLGAMTFGLGGTDVGFGGSGGLTTAAGDVEGVATSITLMLEGAASSGGNTDISMRLLMYQRRQ